MISMIPPDMAVRDLTLSFPSMKRVHFIPTMEKNRARAERTRLTSIRDLVTWIEPTERADYDCCDCIIRP